MASVLKILAAFIAGLLFSFSILAVTGMRMLSSISFMNGFTYSAPETELRNPPPPSQPAADVEALRREYEMLQERFVALADEYALLQEKCRKLEEQKNAEFTGTDEYLRLQNEYILLKDLYEELLKTIEGTPIEERHILVGREFNEEFDVLSDEEEEFLRQNPEILLNLFKKYVFAVEGQMLYWKYPTLDELVAWLAEDDTSEKPYRRHFNCWEFAIMLKIRAKMMGWNMGLLFIEGYRIDDPSKIIDNSTRPPIGEYFYAIHAINTIMLADGRVAYIEPQNDIVFFDLAEYVRQAFGKDFVLLRTIGGAPSSTKVD